MSKLFKFIGKAVKFTMAATAILFTIYWFNLDNKLIKFIEPYLKKNYHTMDRDRRI